MRYRLIARSLADRRRMIVVDDEEDYFLVTNSGLQVTYQAIDAATAHQWEYDRAWVISHDHRPHTAFDLRQIGTYR